MAPGTALQLLALFIVGGATLLWFRRAMAVRLPADRTPFVLAWAGGAAIAAVGLAVGAGSWLGNANGMLALLVGSLLVVLVAISAQKGGTGRFAVGQSVPDFTAQDDTGQAVSIASHAGKPLLLKFFRGHW